MHNINVLKSIIIFVPMPSFCEDTFRIRICQNYSYDMSNWQFGQTRLQRDTLVDSVEKGPLSIAKPISCFGYFAAKCASIAAPPSSTRPGSTKLLNLPDPDLKALVVCAVGDVLRATAPQPPYGFFVSEHPMQRQGEADVSLVDHDHRRESLKY